MDEINIARWSVDDFDEEDDDLSDGVPIQMAIHGLTIADDATPAQVIAALIDQRGEDWVLALPNEVWRQVAAVKVAKWKHRVQMPDDAGKMLPKRGKGDRWV